MITMKEKMLTEGYTYQEDVAVPVPVIKVDDVELMVRGWDTASPTFLINRMRDTIKEMAKEIAKTGATVIIQEKKSNFPGYRKAIAIWKKIEEIND